MTGEERRAALQALNDLREALHLTNTRLDELVMLFNRRLYLGASALRGDDDRSIAIGLKLRDVQVALAEVRRHLEVRP